MKLKTIGVMLVALASFSAVASAKNISDDRAVKAIIGEAENQGPKGMMALACGIRNRGTLKGVYGYLAISESKGNFVRLTPKGPRKISAKIVSEAKAAWQKSEFQRMHSGTHWENTKAFGVPEWSIGMEKVFEYGDHTFFKPQMSKMSKGV